MSNVKKFPGVVEITEITPAELQEHLEEAIKELREAVASGDAKRVVILTDGNRGADICWLDFPKLVDLLGILEMGKILAIEAAAAS